MSTVGAVDAAYLNRVHLPSLGCGSRPCLISTRTLPSGAASPCLLHGTKFLRKSSTSAVKRLDSRRGFGGSDLRTFGTCESSVGLAARFLYSRESSTFGFPVRDRAFCSRLVVAQAKNKNSVEAPERVLAALGYILPLFDGIQYGRYFFLQYPAAEALLRPLYPLLAAYKSFPYSNFIAFFALYLLVVRNDSISRYVRFNAMQAVVLDVLLILPTLVERTFAPRGGVGFELLIIFYNSVFLFLVACFLFGVASCILGRTPRLPIVADAADAQV